MTEPHPDPAPRPPMRHPFDCLPASRYKQVLAVSTLLTIGLMVAIHVTNAPLENQIAPLGIVSLQLAASPTAARAIIASWGPVEQQWALLNLAIDYPYLIAYATTLGLGCLMLAERFAEAGRAARFGVALAWGMVTAACLDAVENALLLALLFGDQRGSWAALACACAVAKYLLVLAALAYLGGGALALLYSAGRKGAEHR